MKRLFRIALLVVGMLAAAFTSFFVYPLLGEGLAVAAGASVLLLVVVEWEKMR